MAGVDLCGCGGLSTVRMVEPSIFSPDEDYLKRRIYTRFYRPCEREEKISSFEYKYHDGAGKTYDICLSCDAQIERALLHDDKDEFVYYIKKFFESAQDVPSWILEQIFQLDSVQCLIALLNGEVGNKFYLGTLGELHRCSKPPLLHLAACYSSIEISNLLLACGPGATPNDRCEIDLYDMKDMLPLNCALKAAGSWIKADGRGNEESIFGLIFHLSSNYMRRYMEMVRLLANWTENVEDEFLNCVKEGKFVEVAALLLVAHQMFLPLSFSKEKHGLALVENEIGIHDFASNEIARIDILQKRSCYAEVDNELLQKWKDKKVKMKMMLLLFEIFERIGYRLRAILHLDPGLPEPVIAATIAWTFKQAGLHFKDRDIYGIPRGGGCANLTRLDNVEKDMLSKLEVSGHEDKRDLEIYTIGIPKIQKQDLSHVLSKQDPSGVPSGSSSYFAGASKELDSAAQPKVASGGILNARFNKLCAFLLSTLKRGMRHM